jgi:3'(2'), 5'-bisphosphate nucleotidase
MTSYAAELPHSVAPVLRLRAPLSDHLLAAGLAEAAGRLLLQLRQAADEVTPGWLRAEGDKRSHEFLLRRLERLRRADAVLSEEGAASRRRLRADRVWIVDPLDGTREFAEPGRRDWAVHVALWSTGRLVAGAVSAPALGGTVTTAAPPRLGPLPERPPRIVVSRSRAPELAEAVAARLGGELVPMGSAGAKVLAVVRGEAEVYLHSGGQYEWDSAAPVAVARAAGLHASRVDGSSLVYNQPNPWLPDVLVCRKELVESVLAAVTTV